MSFPDVPFDEKLFESNELLRSYWDRATDSRPYEMPEGFLESESEDLRSMTNETFSMAEDSKAIEKVETVETFEATEAEPDNAEIIQAKTDAEKSDLVFEKMSDPVPEDTNTKFVIGGFVGIFVVLFIVSKLERY